MQYDKEMFGNKLTRQHTDEQLKKFCTELLNLYSKYLDFNKETIKIYVMERKSPYLEDKGSTPRVKDGVHILIPEIMIDYKLHFYIRDQMIMKMGGKDGIFSQLKNILNKEGWGGVYDKSAIETNGWLMYGCSKPKRSIFSHSYLGS